MEIKNRADIKNFIVDLENKFPVNDWKFKDIHLWPYIRIQLFFYLRNVTRQKEKNNVVSKKTDNAPDQKFFFKFLRKFYHAIVYLILKSKLNHRKILFYGYKAHRVTYEGKLFNRFFDTLVLENKITDNYYFFEKDGGDKKNLWNSQEIISLDKMFEYYLSYNTFKKKVSKKNSTIYLDNYHLFGDYLNTFEATRPFANKFTSNYLKSWVNMTLSVTIDFYEELLLKIKPEKLYILYYYGDLALVAVANKLKIETIEMQHGAQSNEHMAYGSWTKIPSSGYDFLPRTYWSWNESSKNVIEKWAIKNTLYKYFVGGNPWVNFWLNKDEKYVHNDFILYTLQPNHALHELFPEQLMASIITEKYKWFIRLHPRQLNKREEINLFLKKNNIMDLVNVHDATFNPLPVLLKNCMLHITNSSASAIEAAMFNKKTILLHEIGKLYYSDLIESGSAKYVGKEHNFENELDVYMSNCNS